MTEQVGPLPAVVVSRSLWPTRLPCYGRAGILTGDEGVQSDGVLATADLGTLVMAYIRQIREDEATGRLKDVFAAGRAREGKLANIIKVMGLDARSAESSVKLYLSLMKSANALDAPRRELLAAVVSNVNECYY